MIAYTYSYCSYSTWSPTHPAATAAGTARPGSCPPCPCCYWEWCPCSPGRTGSGWCSGAWRALSIGSCDAFGRTSQILVAGSCSCGASGPEAGNPKRIKFYVGGRNWLCRKFHFCYFLWVFGFLRCFFELNTNYRFSALIFVTQCLSYHLSFFSF